MRVAIDKIIKLVPVILLGALAFACEEDPDKLDPMRMFTPAGDIRAVSGETQVKLTWNPSLYTTSASGATYTVEVAADTLFQTPIILSVQTDTAGVVLTDEQLDIRQKYFARIKANALGDRPESKHWAVSSSFMIRGMQIFEALMSTDITDKAVLLKWRAAEGLTQIVLTPQENGGPAGEAITVSLTEEAIAARQELVRGLTPSTAYRAEIFRGNRVVGYLNFTTNAATVGNVIDLTGFTQRPSVLEDTLLQVESGSIIVLKKGVTYTISNTVNLDRSVTIMSENTVEPTKATIFFTSNFNIAEGSQIDSVVFKDVVMRGNDYGGVYVFNIDNASTVGKIKLEGSHAEIFRGIARIKTSGVTIDKFIINNSVIDSVANYGVLTVDNSGARVNDILFSKSTFYKIERPIVSKSSANSIIIEHSTFNDAPEAGRYLVDFSSNDVAQGVQFRNNIVGRGKKIGEDNAVKGIRVGSSTLVESSSSYATSDYNATGNQIPNLTVYSGTATDLFQDPKNGDFTIKDPNFAGKSTAGDPRWR
ncbi:uncharacterized protein DUF4957 [Pontibacter ummariensis]|uniref:DUF5123 domain-containing protein n=1 Tax=Pontibacter ummariensis TaxID=1610492 RepID=A0A239H1S6_9BACT|nr:DUF5123 domain-containing protein [Pontibacter ummariensis]PRY10919.1 uncharacterized protein DUF4957 [Pontibacter ummariensis]SNS75426.1 protein of unknown function [Pontibacter ummariensis]